MMASPEFSQRLNEYASNLVLSDKRRYLEKVSDVGDPYCIPAEQLHRKGLPPVTRADVFNYLVLTESFCTSEKFKAFKSLEAYKYFENGFVNVLAATNIDDNSQGRIVTVGRYVQWLD